MRAVGRGRHRVAKSRGEIDATEASTIKIVADHHNENVNNGGDLIAIACLGRERGMSPRVVEIELKTGSLMIRRRIEF